MSKITTSDYETDCTKADQCNYLKIKNEAEYSEINGVVYTQNGIVDVQAYREDNTDYDQSRMVFIYNGKEYERYWSAWWQPRTLVTLAHNFTFDVVNGKITQ